MSQANPFERTYARYVATPEQRADALKSLIEEAQESICLQMYLLAGNEELTTLCSRPNMPPWSHTFAQWLIDKQQQNPDMPIVVILDTQTPDQAHRTRGRRGPLTRHVLEDAGVIVLNANLFSTQFNPHPQLPLPGMMFHRTAWRHTPMDRWVAAQQRWQTLHNVEDHRKNLIIDAGRRAGVTSHNLIDIASDWHENLLIVDAPVARDIWRDAQITMAEALKLPQRINATQRRRHQYRLHQDSSRPKRGS